MQRAAAASCSYGRSEAYAADGAAFASVSPNPPSLLKFSVAVFVDGDRCLTDLAANKYFPMQAYGAVANVATDGAC